MRKDIHGRMLLLAGMVALSMLLALLVGSSWVSPASILYGFLGEESSISSLIVLQIRLPRIIVAAVCGIGLALSGCVLQGVTGNVLADPGILGINAGAGACVMLLLSVFPALQGMSSLFQPLAALIGSLGAVTFLALLAFRQGRIQPRLLLLGGIAISAGFTALMLVIGADMENASYQSVARWLTGTLWGSSWRHVVLMLPYVLLLPLLYSHHRVLDILGLGSDTAVALGVEVEKERRLLLACAAASAAFSISVSGGIGFVGLVSPHIARRLVGGRHRALLPASALVGALVVLWADTLGRIVLPGGELPVGIVVALVASPYFIFLLKQQGRMRNRE